MVIVSSTISPSSKWRRSPAKVASSMRRWSEANSSVYSMAARSAAV